MKLDVILPIYLFQISAEYIRTSKITQRNNAGFIIAATKSATETSGALQETEALEAAAQASEAAPTEASTAHSATTSSIAAPASEETRHMKAAQHKAEEADTLAATFVSQVSYFDYFLPRAMLKDPIRSFFVVVCVALYCPFWILP